MINERCHVDNKGVPAGIQVASYFNKTRDVVNAAVFENYCRENKPCVPGAVLGTAVLVFMDQLEINNNNKTYVPLMSNYMKKLFYTTVRENDCKFKKNAWRNRVDPVLKLYKGCPMMHTENTVVGSGQANGTRVLVDQIILKYGEKPFTVELECGTIVWGVFSSSVKYVSVTHVVPDMEPPSFSVTTQNFSFSCALETCGGELTVAMKGEQFPIISNSCTTGHKLQGSTMDELLVDEWQYKQNWVYVVLSRVKTMKGLYIRTKLKEDLEKYEMPVEMKAMLRAFSDNIGIKDLTDEDYTRLEKVTAFVHSTEQATST
jgi:hypothetical protein